VSEVLKVKEVEKKVVMAAVCHAPSDVRHVPT